LGSNINIKYTVYSTGKYRSRELASQIRPRRSSYEDLNSVLGCMQPNTNHFDCKVCSGQNVRLHCIIYHLW